MTRVKKLTRYNINQNKKHSRYKLFGMNDKDYPTKKYSNALTWEEIEEIPTIEKEKE